MFGKLVPITLANMHGIDYVIWEVHSTPANTALRSATAASTNAELADTGREPWLPAMTEGRTGTTGCAAEPMSAALAMVCERQRN